MKKRKVMIDRGKIEKGGKKEKRYGKGVRKTCKSQDGGEKTREDIAVSS